jgi:hypothetical protein
MRRRRRRRRTRRRLRRRRDKTGTPAFYCYGKREGYLKIEDGYVVVYGAFLLRETCEIFPFLLGSGHKRLDFAKSSLFVGSGHKRLETGS